MKAILIKTASWARKKSQPLIDCVGRHEGQLYDIMIGFIWICISVFLWVTALMPSPYPEPYAMLYGFKIDVGPQVAQDSFMMLAAIFIFALAVPKFSCGCNALIFGKRRSGDTAMRFNLPMEQRDERGVRMHRTRRER